MSSDVHAKWMNSAARSFRHAGEALLQPILDGLHVVVGDALDGLHALGVGRAEARVDGIDGRPRLGAEGRELHDARLVGERDEPGQLDAHAMADEAEFGEVGGERGHLRRIAAVERRQRGERGEFVGHGVSQKARRV